jgi:hypothetical protein
MPIRWLVVTTVVVAVMSACTQSGTTSPRNASPTTTPQGSWMPPVATSPPQSEPPAEAILDSTALECRNYIGAQPPDDAYEIVLGVVALQTSRAGPALQAFDREEPGPARLFAKSGLLIRADTTFELQVPPEITDRMSIGWGSSGDLSHRLVVADCQPRAGDSAKWLVYAGGYYVDEVMCAALTVKTDGREKQVRLGIGAPCPGQAPPEGP